MDGQVFTIGDGFLCEGSGSGFDGGMNGSEECD